MKTKREPSVWPLGLSLPWAGKKPLGCETVHAHVLFREGDFVWVHVDGEGGVSLVGRRLEPSERPSDALRSAAQYSRQLPEFQQRWINGMVRPSVAAINGVCHLFIDVKVSNFAPYDVWREGSSGFCLVRWDGLIGYLDGDLAVAMAEVYCTDEDAVEVSTEEEKMAA